MNAPRPNKRIPRPAGSATRHVYDVIVLGSQVGGLAAGALLARRGLRVLHVDHDGLFDGYADGGYLLPFQPSLLPALKGIPSVQAVLDELGIASDIGRTLEPYPGGLQVILPRARLELARDPVVREQELARELGAQASRAGTELAETLAIEDAATAFLAPPLPLPADGMLERMALGRAMRRFPAASASDLPITTSHPLGAALHALIPFTSFVDEAPSALGFARTVGPIVRGPCRFPGGREGLARALRTAIKTHGGDTLGDRGAPAVAEELLLDGSRFTGIQLLGGAAYRARVLVAATDAAALRRLVPPSRRQKKLSELADMVRPRRFVFSLNLVLRDAGIPPGLGEVALVVLPDRPETLLEIAPTRDERGAIVEGHKTVTAAACLPYSLRDLGEEALRDAVAELREVLEEVLPFHDRHLVLASAPYLAAVGSRGSRLLPHPILELSLPRTLAVEGLPTRSPVQRMLLASREVLPGLGLEGEFLAGLRAAELTSEMCRKIDPLV